MTAVSITVMIMTALVRTAVFKVFSYYYYYDSRV